MFLSTSVGKAERDPGSYQFANASLLFPRDDFACSKGVPCKQDACCGSFGGTNTGICGLGPTFCGSDCDSKCNAKAECGQGADPPGKACPLNVCCSQFGFCGSTEPFCATGCQSNCVVSPAVPAGKASKPVLENRVIGYYEAWAARSSCHAFTPANVPTDGLTHVNFAFAFIDPATYQVVPMDSDTPGGLFADMTDIKTMKTGNSDLKIFISIGGWTFSDNGTATQPLFSAIAADSSKRQQFADNLVAFMNRYGFDGVDLDWEYPGAPDRGGLLQYDVTNYVELMKTLRQTFKSSSRGNYGLSFTIPSSYWYLRWFDVPGLLKYADWTNLMSYDLHGTWDASNPIGSIVQAHTNLTEIKSATDLLWRSNVQPEQVVLGLGFYGRSFQLSDKDCSKPGCAFKGPADPGPCTANAGTLAYFELTDLIKNEKPTVIHDTDSAVKYFVYGSNKDQWISYDDKDTFKAKTDWANSVGLGGVMVWSVDQDDGDYSALEGLLGKSLPETSKALTRRQKVNADHWTSLNGQACVVTDCEVDDWQPPPGFAIVPEGKYRDTCNGIGKGFLKNVYCPVSASPTSCVWRGSGSCHGQCHPGEVTLAHSPYGSEKCLAPGMQALCCVSNTWSKLVDKCAWADRCDDCPSDSHFAVASRDANLLSCGKQKFCCPYNFDNCHWVGKGTCDDNECGATDVQVALDPYGDSWTGCVGGTRKKSLCCNAPKDLNFFLPASLEDLFPTLPPVEYIPAFEKQIIPTLPDAKAVSDLESGFLFIAIDGPSDVVTNLRKRDGSHIQFVTGPVHHGQATQTAHFVCMDNSASSNCNDMHLGGIEGTIVRLPDDLGFAQWGVAHAVRSSNYSLPRHLLPRAPPRAAVMELEYSYDFSKVKRGTGDIFLRVDYSDDGKYYTDIVQGKHPQKRNVERRFWSKVVAHWQAIIKSVRQRDSKPPPHQLGDKVFKELLIADNGRRANCNGNDGFLSLGLSGRARSTMRWGFTFVGKISPFAIEEAYGYFDVNLWLAGQLTFDGKGYLDMGKVAGSERMLFPSPLTGYGLSHPGIVSFSPELNVGLSLVGAGELDGQFTVDFEAGTSRTITTNAPPTLGVFEGESLQSSFGNAAKGKLAVNDTRYDTVFAVNMVPEARMAFKIFDYGTTQRQAGAVFAARTPHAIRILGNNGVNKPVVVDVTQQAESEVYQTGTVQKGWDDGTTHLIGSRSNPVQLLTGGGPPDPRKPTDPGGPAIFGEPLISCSSKQNVTCHYDLTRGDSSFVNLDPETDVDMERRSWRAGLDRQVLESSTDFHELDKRGGKNTYIIRDINNAARRIDFVTPTYPSGRNGERLDAVLPESSRKRRWSIANPENCDDTNVTPDGTSPSNWQQIDADHAIDRSIIATFGEFVQSGRITTDTGTEHITSLPLFTFDQLQSYWTVSPATWPEAERARLPADAARTVAMTEVANALGSRTNPNDMVNLDSSLNTLKGRIYTRRGDATRERTWNEWMADPSSVTADHALSSIRALFSMFNYMNSITQQRHSVLNNIRDALERFDSLYETATQRPERMVALHDEFWAQWNTYVVDYNREYIRRRLDSLEHAFADQVDHQPLVVRHVLDVIETLRGKIDSEIKLD